MHPPIFDTHAHLCAAEFADDLEQVLGRARETGVAGVLAVGESLEDARSNLEIRRRSDGFVAMAAGLFPTLLDLDQAESVEGFLRENRNEIAAVGEVGLDYWKVAEGPDRDLQRELFGRFVDLAIELDLPLNVHSRSAGRATIEFLLERGATRVQMHAFDGRAANAWAGVEAGFFFSVPPSIVRSPQKQKLVRRLPIESLLLETDSPVLGPEKSARNEPANARVALEAISALKQAEPAAVAEAIRANTRRLYGPIWPDL